MIEILYGYGEEGRVYFLSDAEFRDALACWQTGASYWCQRLKRLLPKPTLDVGEPPWAKGRMACYCPEMDAVFLYGYGIIWSGQKKPDIQNQFRLVTRTDDHRMKCVFTGEVFKEDGLKAVSEDTGMMFHPIITSSPVQLEDRKLYGGSGDGKTIEGGVSL